MLWEGEPLPATKARLKELGIQSIVFAPCGNRPESGDFLSVMQQNLANLKTIEDVQSNERNPLQNQMQRLTKPKESEHARDARGFLPLSGKKSPKTFVDDALPLI